MSMVESNPMRYLQRVCQERKFSRWYARLNKLTYLFAFPFNMDLLINSEFVFADYASTSEI